MIENIKTDDIQIDESQTQYSISKEAKKIVEYVAGRTQAMKSARQTVDKDRDLYQDMINAVFEPYPDERSSSTVPLASSLIELFVSEATKVRPDFRFRGEGKENKVKAKAYEHVWKYDWRTEKRQQTFDQSEYIVAAFGTQIMHTGFVQNSYTQTDMTVGDDMMPTFSERSEIESKIIIKDLDIRNVWLDNHAIDSVNQMGDWFYEEWMSYDKFKLLEGNPMYTDIDKVNSVGYSHSNTTFTTIEEDSKQGKYVKITKYENVDKDRYIEIANDKVLIRAHPLMSTIRGKKALSLSVRGLGRKNYSMYHRGLCEACLMFNSEINNLREMLMDGIRRSNSQTLAIGNGLSFDGRKFSYDNEILLFDGQLNGNLQQLSGNPPNQAIFNYLDRLYKDIAVYCGLDIQNIVGEPNQTAYQTEVQREASQKRVALWLKNRDYAYERLADLHMENLQKFFPLKLAEQVVPAIEIEGEEFDGKRFKKIKGTSMFELTADMLDGPVLVDVFTDTSIPTIDAVRKAQSLELMSSIGNLATQLANAKQAGVDMDSYLSVKSLIKETVDGYNLNLQESDQEELEQKKQGFKKELANMQQQANQPLPSTLPGATSPQTNEPTGSELPIAGAMEMGETL